MHRNRITAHVLYAAGLVLLFATTASADDIAPIPEPATTALLLTAAGGYLLHRRRQKQAGGSKALTTFSFLWAATQLLDLLCFPEWMFEPSGVVLFVSALALLVKPSSFGRLLVMSASAVVYLYVRSPITPNHQLFEGFVNLAILVVALRHRRLPIEAARAATFAEVASVLGMLLWMPYSVALLGALLLGWPAANSDERAGTLLHMHRSPAVALLVLFVLNGMAPYFGFQTLRTMSMFSNLRTEGGRTNHLFIPSSLQIASYQKDLVRLIGSSDPWLDFYVRNESLLPYSELRRRVWEHPDVPVQVTYERNGRIETLDTSQPGADRQVSQVPTPVNKILAFREVDQDGRPVRCLW